jgi:UDP-glucose 4-epimerase
VRVLLTGASGLIGRAVVRLLGEAGHDVLATDLHPLPVASLYPPPVPDAPPSPIGSSSPQWLRLDVRHREQVQAALVRWRPDAVVHLAARHFIPWCQRFPAATLRTNVLGTQNVLDGARHSGVAKLVFASSAAVYGPSPQALDESCPLGPDDVYGVSKASGEQLVRLASQGGENLDTVVLRLFNTIGPGDRNPHLIPRLVSELRRGGRRLRLGNLQSVRDYVYVEDVARAILAAVEAELPGHTTVNIGGGAGRSVEEVVEVLEGLVGQTLEVLSTPARRRTVDRPFLVADRARAQRLLSWEPGVAFAEGLMLTLRAGGVRLAGEDGAALTEVRGAAQVELVGVGA